MASNNLIFNAEAVIKFTVGLCNTVAINSISERWLNGKGGCTVAHDDLKDCGADDFLSAIGADIDIQGTFLISVLIMAHEDDAPEYTIKEGSHSKVDDNHRLTFSIGRPFFVHDPQGDCFSFFETEKERDQYADECIAFYLDEFWDPEVVNICAGVMTHQTRETDVEQRPDNVDEEGVAPDGSQWLSDCDYKCNYKLFRVEGGK